MVTPNYDGLRQTPIVRHAEVRWYIYRTSKLLVVKVDYMGQSSGGEGLCYSKFGTIKISPYLKARRSQA
jgi:hypothetical protein